MASKPRMRNRERLLGASLLFLSTLILAGASAAYASGAPLTPPAIIVTPGTIDVGQSETLSTSSGFSGGTPPYVCTWLVRVPGATSFSPMGSPFTCDTSSLPSTSSGPLPVKGTWSFELKVVDSSRTPRVVRSPPESVKVNAQLGVPSLSPSPSVIDANQQLSVTVKWTGGTPPFRVNLNGTLGGACGPTSPLIAALNVTKPGSAAFRAISLPPGSYGLCASVTDSAGAPAGRGVTTYSTEVTVAVNPALTPPEADSSKLVIDVGQNATLMMSAPFGGGTPPYTCGWFKEGPNKTSFSSLGGFATCSTSSSSSLSTGKMKVTGIWAFYLVIRDSAGSPATIPSGVIFIQVNAGIQRFGITSDPVRTTVGNKVTLSTNKALAGGTPLYFCQWLDKPPGARMLANMGFWFYCLQHTRPSNSTAPLMVQGVWEFELQVTDSNGFVRAVHTFVHVGPGLQVPTVTPSRIAIAIGMNISVKVAWRFGTPNFTVNLRTAPIGKRCDPTSTLVGSANVNASSYTFTGLAPNSTRWYCSDVTDSSAARISQSSAAVKVTVARTLANPNFGFAFGAVDIGQQGLMSTTTPPAGGTPGYSCQWLQAPPGYSTFSPLGSPFVCGNFTSSMSTGPLSTVGTWQYEIRVTDAAHHRATSGPVPLVVNPTLTPPTIEVTPTTVSPGQIATLTQLSPFAGGTPGYSCLWLQEGPHDSSFSPLGSPFSCDPSTLAAPMPTGPLTIPGVWTFCLQVTDSSGTPETVQSPPVTVTVG